MATLATATGVNSGTSTASAASATNKKNVVGKDEFLKMLLAQLKNQNPLNPMDGTQFAAQLAQFSTVEQIMNMATSLDGMISSMKTMNNAQMTALIGNEVSAKGNTVGVTGAASTLMYDLTGPIQKGTIKVFNSNGALVKSLDIGSQAAGVNTVAWDSSGLPTGTYTFDVAATDKNGVAVPATALISGRITGVSYKEETPYITVNGTDIAFSSVVSVKKPAS